MTHGPDISAAIGELARARVLIMGDAMLDRFVYGAVERISPEAPIPVFRIERETEMLGGAGNVARNLVALGAHARFVAATGADAAADALHRLIDSERAVDKYLIADPARRTGIKTRYIAGNQQMLRADDETVAPLDGPAHEAMLAAAMEGLDDCAVVVLSDYGKGVLAGGIAAEVIAKAQAAGKTVIVDPQGTDYEAYRGADVVTPNRKELAEAAGASADSADAVVQAAKRLIDAHRFGAVIATLGGDGMVVVGKDGTVETLAANARDVFDVSGAGDTVVAALAAGLAAGWDLVTAAELANVAAGIVVGKVGTAVAYTDEIVTEMHQRSLMASEAKVVPLAAALDRVAVWRGQNRKIGFTNGCFDLLHPGHVSLLRQAKTACDHLIVGLNSDASTKRLKGDSRPVQNEAARAAVLASLADVDLVVIFGEDTPVEIIEAIRPDVFIKGADYRVEDIPEAKVVQGYGGDVMLADLVEGQSTTSTIARMAK
jgi:D-beta-D-heptose 7-phosphate kinase/D-beta-D-heptose 1-phosphate adenosyltransferase